MAKKLPKCVAKYSPRNDPGVDGLPAADHGCSVGGAGGAGGGAGGGGGGGGGRGRLNRRAQTAPGTTTGLGCQTPSWRA